MSVMRDTKTYYVYIMTNKSGTLYTRVTNNIRHRVRQHKDKLVAGFTKKYNVDRLIYYECFADVHAAIGREKTIKGWLRRKKLDLIASINPQWDDLSEGWYD
jgi:putative endonuclease